MSTLEIAPPGTRGQPATERVGQGAAPRISPAGGGLLIALLVLVLYGAFDHGAGSVAAGARLQVALAAIASAAAATYLWNGSLRISLPRVAVFGIVSLTAFAIWSGVSLLWSVAPDRTWMELNRALSYELLLVLAIVAGASAPRAIELLAAGTLFVVLIVTLYALGQKIIPGVHVGGVLDLNQTQVVPRLQEPFGYWNALGLFVVFGIPIALALTVDRSRRTRVRLTGLLSIELMLLAMALTYSRGAVLALVVALAVAIGIGGDRARSMMWLALACVATVPALVFGLMIHDLTASSIAIGARETAGAELGGVLLGTLAALWLAGARLIALEPRIAIGPQRARLVGRAMLGAVGVAIVCGVIALALSSRGLGGTVSHEWHSFTRTETTSNYDPARLVSADSANRWVWWKEAAGAFSDRPLAGWGAGSFPVVHLLYRRDTLSVQQPHSVPLQFLAETGITGALLAAAAYLLVAAGALAGVTRRARADRLLAAAVFAGVVGYGIHSCYDWDWDIPGVTLPVLLLAGVLVGSHRSAPKQGPERGLASGIGARLIALVAITATACAFALSGVVPSVAASRASSALVAASSPSRVTQDRALRQAQSAAHLDPLSDAGLMAAATIESHLGNLERSRAYLVQAIGRDPEDAQAWARLAVLEISLHGDGSNWITAIKRTAALDPLGPGTATLARFLSLANAPPADSATARVTPMTAAEGDYNRSSSSAIAAASTAPGG